MSLGRGKHGLCAPTAWVQVPLSQLMLSRTLESQLISLSLPWLPHKKNGEIGALTLQGHFEAQVS